MDRRFPRSPSLKSPVLSPKSPAIYEKYKSGCAWGLIHFFDFRQGHAHGKLISDKKRDNRLAKVDGCPRRPDSLSNEANQLRDDELNKMEHVNGKKLEVKKVLEGEMPVKHQADKNKVIAEKLQHKPKLVEHSKDRPKAINKYKKSSRLPARGSNNARTSTRNMVESSSYHYLAPMTESSSNDVHTNNGGRNIPGRKHDHLAEINLRVHMSEAVEAFVNQKFTDGENLSKSVVENQSKNFIDAIEILNSNKELFMKLLQDPNSLLVKHIQGLRDSQAKQQHAQSSSIAEDQSSSTIVVLKPEMENCPGHSSKKKQRAIRPAFLSFERMKKRLRHAMRVNKKEHHDMSQNCVYKSQHDFEHGGKGMSAEADDRNSTHKSYLDVEEVSKSSSTKSWHRTSNPLTVKGKLHHRNDLPEILNRRNEDFLRKQTVNRFMSLAERDLLPTFTPKRGKGHEFASPQMRFSPYGNFSNVNRYNWMVQKDKKSGCFSSSPMSDNGKPDDQLHVANRSSNCYSSPATKISLEPNSTNNNERTEAVNLSKEREYFDCSKLDSPVGDKTTFSSLDVYSSSSLHSPRVKDSASMTDEAEHPSPISVLEQFVTEDNISSPSSTSLAAEPPIERSCIDIEELYASSTNMQGSLSEFIRAVVQISGLSWDEVSRKGHFSEPMLDTSLFDNVEVWPGSSCTNSRLLLDYISEVIFELHQCYFICSPWISVLNPKPRRVLLTKIMAHEVLRHVDWPLLSELPQQTLQQLVEKDLNSGAWLDTRTDMEDVISDLVDSIVEDLLFDTRV